MDRHRTRRAFFLRRRERVFEAKFGGLLEPKIGAPSGSDFP